MRGQFELKRAVRRLFRQLGWHSGARRAALIVQIFRELFGIRPAPHAPNPDFANRLARQPYEVEIDGLNLIVEKDVFPPDFGQIARKLARSTQNYAPRTALDVGCGTGYLALMTKMQGATEVWASDIHPPAVACTLKNLERNPHAGPVTVVQSDLLTKIPADKKFDLIMFNQPFAPGDQRRPCGCGPDGGYEICRRFMLTASEHLSRDGVLLMPFSDRAAEENDPELVAKELGYAVKTLLREYYDGATNMIYEIRPKTARK